MPRRISRSDYLEARQALRLDLSAAKADPSFRAKVEAAGLSLDALDQLDLYERDGVLEGPRELRALFDLLKGLERGGAADTLTVKPLGWSADPVDQAFHAVEARLEASPARAPLPPLSDAGRARLPLSAAVGRGAPNRAADVRLVQARLRDVGFDVGVDGQFGPRTEQALKTYRAMLTGADETKDEPGLVAPDDLVHHALAAVDPPRWERMPKSGPGFVNEDTDGFGFGSAETRLAIEEIGAAYARDYLAGHPGAARLSVNDVSERHGGHNADHDTHENGLDLDLRLPRTDGASGSDVRWANYDREATWAMLQAIAANPRVERVLFSDATLLARARETKQPWAWKLFDGGPVHRNHLHVDVRPPVVTPQ
ncbi:MAG: peptidoglycan-binding domain-containing protein [Myxococcota bacterium]